MKLQVRLPLYPSYKKYKPLLSDRNTNLSCPTEVQTSLVRQKCKPLLSDRSTNLSCPTEVQTSLVRQKYKLLLSDINTNLSCPTEVQTCLVRQKYKPQCRRYRSDSCLTEEQSRSLDCVVRPTVYVSASSQRLPANRPDHVISHCK